MTLIYFKCLYISLRHIYFWTLMNDHPVGVLQTVPSYLSLEYIELPIHIMVARNLSMQHIVICCKMIICACHNHTCSTVLFARQVDSTNSAIMSCALC